MEHTNIDPLLPDLAAGDERAFSLLYEQFGLRLYRAAMGLLGRSQDAEDAVQDVFAALVRSRRQLVMVNDLTAYLFTMLRHAAARCAATREENCHFQNNLEQISARQDCPADRLYDLDFQHEFQHALNRLPVEQREVISYRQAGELTFAQIGNILNISTQTAASRYRYALEKLRVLLKEDRP